MMYTSSKLIIENATALLSDIGKAPKTLPSPATSSDDKRVALPVVINLIEQYQHSTSDFVRHWHTKNILIQRLLNYLTTFEAESTGAIRLLAERLNEKEGFNLYIEVATTVFGSEKAAKWYLTPLPAFKNLSPKELAKDKPIKLLRTINSIKYGDFCA